MTTALIAESGATKTEWRLLVDGKLTLSVRGTGFNPNVMTPDHIDQEMGKVYREHFRNLEPQSLFFYGAGIGGASQEAIMRRVLSSYWPETDIRVKNDLTAAARSTMRPEGIVCIIGTGSNSCHHRDHEVVARRGGHGYLFGDEGSGMDLGRHLVMGLLQEAFPPVIQRFVESQEGLSVYELKLAILRDTQPNVRMARLAKHLGELLHHESIREMILGRFSAFLETTVCMYPGFNALHVDVMGSIGWHFQDLFREAAEERSVQVGRFLKDPINDLVTFHQHLLTAQQDQ